MQNTTITQTPNHKGGAIQTQKGYRPSGVLLRPFLEVLCTLYWLNQSRRIKAPESAESRKWVHIPTNRPKAPQSAPDDWRKPRRARYLDGDLFDYRKGHSHKAALQYLEAKNVIGRRTVKTPDGHQRHEYTPLFSDWIDYVNPESIYNAATLPEPHEYMRGCLTRVTLPDAALSAYIDDEATTPESAAYIVYALENLNQFTALFYNVDTFGNRVHTPFTTLPEQARAALLIDGEPVIKLDVKTMQPAILGSLLKTAIPNNEYSKWIDSGADVYEMLQERANLNTRQQAKQLFFEIAFGKPSDDLKNYFGSVDWVDWINAVKRDDISGKPPKYKGKPHNNLAFILQRIETAIFEDIWKALQAEQIPFISVHDEVITKRTHAERTRQIMYTHLRATIPAAEIKTS